VEDWKGGKATEGLLSLVGSVHDILHISRRSSLSSVNVSCPEKERLLEVANPFGLGEKESGGYFSTEIVSDLIHALVG
jgi:hypothetical protein